MISVPKVPHIDKDPELKPYISVNGILESNIKKNCKY